MLAAASSGGPCVTPAPDPAGDSPLPARTPAEVAARCVHAVPEAGEQPRGLQGGRGLLATGRLLGQVA